MVNDVDMKILRASMVNICSFNENGWHEKMVLDYGSKYAFEAADKNGLNDWKNGDLLVKHAGET